MFNLEQIPRLKLQTNLGHLGVNYGLLFYRGASSAEFFYFSWKEMNRVHCQYNGQCKNVSSCY